ncbi:MAG: hypothetical protein ABI858_02080 [Pseudoxanthomonas sp.]
MSNQIQPWMALTNPCDPRQRRGSTGSPPTDIWGFLQAAINGLFQGIGFHALPRIVQPPTMAA